MRYIIYISSARRKLNHDDLLDILTVSRQNNEKRNLTGMLLYSGETFIQVLEGDEYALKTTYATITNDTRHGNIIKMMEGELEERNFPEWTMGFKSINADELIEFNGYINPGETDILKQGSDNAIIGLLKTFADVNRLS